MDLLQKVNIRSLEHALPLCKNSIKILCAGLASQSSVFGADQIGLICILEPVGIPMSVVRDGCLGCSENNVRKPPAKKPDLQGEIQASAPNESICCATRAESGFRCQPSDKSESRHPIIAWLRSVYAPMELS